MTSGGMPTPLSLTAMATYSPSATDLAPAESDVLRRDRHDAAVGHGIARVDDEVDQGDFQFADVGRDRPHPGGISIISPTCPPSPLERTSRIELSRCAISIGCGLTRCRLENVSSCRVRAAPRWVANSIACAARAVFGSCAATAFSVWICPPRP
jgi:hypothetical protein